MRRIRTDKIRTRETELPRTCSFSFKLGFFFFPSKILLFSFNRELKPILRFLIQTLIVTQELEKSISKFKKEECLLFASYTLMTQAEFCIKKKNLKVTFSIQI